MSGPPLDTVTVMRGDRDRRATKLVTGLPDGSVRIDPYDAGALFAVTQRFLMLPSRGQIARNFGETAQLAVLVSQGGNNYIGPETRAVLA